MNSNKMQTRKMLDDEQYIISSVGLRIAELRSKQDLTRVELAKKSELHVQYLYDLEIGKRNITIYVLAKIAQSLNTTSSALLKDLVL